MKQISLKNNAEKKPERVKAFAYLTTQAVLPGGNEGFAPCPELLTDTNCG
jgi:hypothetical protein